MKFGTLLTVVVILLGALTLNRILLGIFRRLRRLHAEREAGREAARRHGLR